MTTSSPLAWPQRPAGTSANAWRDLLLTDQVRRWQQGYAEAVEAYLARYPDLAADPDLVLDLVAGELFLRRERGEAPALDAFAPRFPAWADRLPGFFAAEEVLASLESRDTLRDTPGEQSPARVTLAPPLPPSYRFLDVLGRGGMGDVYLAEHLATGERVAIKLPRLLHNPQRELARFENEVRAASGLVHPNICPIRGWSLIEQPPYLVMAYVPGPLLSDLVAGGQPLPVAQAVHLVQRLALAFQFAHDRGVLHRDIKPSNVIVNEQGEPIVLDFGLASLSDAGLVLTSPGEVPGSLPYTAPERLQGHDASAASDVWGLAAVLFELLTGRRAYPGTEAEVIAAITRGSVPHVRDLCPDLPAHLDAVVARALHADPAKRYQSMADFANDLQLLPDGEPPTVSDSGHPPRRRRRAAALVVAAGVVLLLGGGLLLGRWLLPTPGPLPVARPRTPLTRKHVLQSILAHQQSLPPPDRPAQRYFLLDHLHNDPALSDADLRQVRVALARALNSLHWKANPVLPRPIDPDETVLAIDLRPLDWDAAGPDGRTPWNRLQEQYPYGLTFRSVADPDEQRLARRVYELTRDDLPMLRADWFVAAATRPPLYGWLLDLPPALSDLEMRLGVDRQRAFLNDQVVRAGLGAGACGGPRLVERLPTEYGALWRTFDLPGDARALLARPLGPSFAGHPHPEAAFAPAGGQVLFHLPDGLLGFLTVDAEGRRRDASPVPADGEERGTACVPGLAASACLGCHARGVVPVTDELRERATVSGEVAAKLRRLHPEPAGLASLLAADAARLRTAAAEMAGQSQPADPDTEQPEPIEAVARRYWTAPVDAAMAARELGLGDETELVTAATTERLRAVGLMALAEGGSIARVAWQGSEPRATGNTVFQVTARTLQVGTPSRRGH